MRGIFFQPEAWEQYIELHEDRNTLKKVHALIKDIQRNGYQFSYGKPERLRGNFSGYSSVRIDKKNRLVFDVDDKKITIVECGGHYSDR